MQVQIRVNFLWTTLNYVHNILLSIENSIAKIISFYCFLYIIAIITTLFLSLILSFLLIDLRSFDFMLMNNRVENS